jgi:hypothetical protein
MPWHNKGTRVKGESLPRRSSDTAWNQILVLFDQRALCSHPRHWVGTTDIGLLAPKNQIIGTFGTGSTIRTTDLVSVLLIKTLRQLKIRLSVFPGQGRKYRPPIKSARKTAQNFRSTDLPNHLES